MGIEYQRSLTMGVRPCLRSGKGRSRGLALALVLAICAFTTAAGAQQPADPEPGWGSEEEADPAERGEAPAPPDPEGPKLVMPQVVHFEEAPFPPEAIAAGIEAAHVDLRLDIDAEGKVTGVEVVAPVGHGFDEAAAAAARRFVFEPARRDGEPLPVRILYRYTFEQQLVEPEVEEEAPRSGSLIGTVLIAGPDLPLASAEITLVGPDGQERRIQTDEGGRWMLDDAPAGAYQLVIAAPGFEPLTLSEEVLAGESSEVTYRLAPVVEEGGVVVRGTRPPREVTRRTISRREMARVPGTSGDALRAIQSLPGVARPPALAGLLIVRGAAPQDTLTFADSAEIPLIYHFGGVRSVFPTELLDEINFYPSNFSARYGRAMGGIVDVSLRSPDTRCTGDYGKPTDEDGCFHGLAQVDLLDARVLLQGPIGGGWTFALGGQRSHVDAWLEPLLDTSGASLSTAPVYYDYQAIAEKRGRDGSRTSVRFYGADDRFRVLVRDPLVQDPGVSGDVNFGTASYTAQLLHEQPLASGVELWTSLAAGRTAGEFSMGPILARAETFPIQTRSELRFRLARGVKLNAGLDFLMVPFDFAVRAPPPPRPGEPPSGPLFTQTIMENSGSGTFFRPAWYAEAEVKPTERLLLVPGARLDYARDAGNADFSPRLTGRYLLRGNPGDSPGEDAPLRTTLKGGVGVFAQPPQPVETDPVFGTPGLISNRSIHYSVGVEQELSRRVELSVEGYYKDLKDLVARSPDLASVFTYDNLGSGSVIGMETLLRYQADPRFFGWVAYTLSRSVRRDGPDEPLRLFQFDQTHILTALGSYRLGAGWEFGARFRVISGMLHTPMQRAPGLPALYAADTGTYVPLPGEPFSERLPLVHQLDVRIERAWQFRTWRLAGYLDVWNVYNNAPVETYGYNYNFTVRTPQTGLPLIPSLGVRGEF